MSCELVKPVLDLSVRELCKRPYTNHPKGCPNYGKKKGCPPQALLLNEVLDLAEPVWAVWVKFDLAAHRERMRGKHPNWSRRQLDCLLYWQGTVLKELRHKVCNFCTMRLLYKQSKNLDAYYCPEAMGVNVTETMRQIGVELEWPPKISVRKIALVGTPLQSGRKTAKKPIKKTLFED